MSNSNHMSTVLSFWYWYGGNPYPIQRLQGSLNRIPVRTSLIISREWHVHHCIPDWKSIAPPARKKLTATPQLRTAPLTVLRQLQTHSTLMHRLSMPVPLLLLAFMNRKGQDTCAANELLTDHSATRREPCDIPCGWWAIFTLQEHLFKFKLLRKLYLEVDWKLFLVDWKSFFIGCFKEYWSTNLFSTHLKLSLCSTC